MTDPLRDAEAGPDIAHAPIEFLDRESPGRHGGARLAHRWLDGRGPALVFLPGYLSDMAGSKATALLEWSAHNGRACLLLDYSGCGLSDGDFAEGTLSRWRDEVLKLIEAKVAEPVVLVGSSMGGWLMLLVGLALGRTEAGRLAGLIGIAAAPDFSDWGYDEAQKARLRAGETVWEDNPYRPDPTPVWPAFWHDAELSRVLDGDIAISCPVRLLHGQQDRDVPWEISLRLAERLFSDDIQVTLVKQADHRMSRGPDIELLLRTVAELPAI